jgi:hypothetical protein
LLSKHHKNRKEKYLPQVNNKLFLQIVTKQSLRKLNLMIKGMETVEALGRARPYLRRDCSKRKTNEAMGYRKELLLLILIISILINAVTF